MTLGDVFRSLLGIPREERPRGAADDMLKDNDPLNSQPRGESGFHSGTFPGGVFFFGNVPPPESFFPGLGERKDNEEEQGEVPHNQPFGFFDPPPRVHDGRGQDDMFRHFDDMFRSFNEVFKNMGVADFPAFPNHFHQLPGPGQDGSRHKNEEQLSPRDSMLKTPDSPLSEQKPAIVTPSQPQLPHSPPSNRPSNTPHQPFSFFGDKWQMPQWNRPAMPQNILDDDLDEEVRKGGLDNILRILEPHKKSTPSFPGVRIMEPPSSHRPEGYHKAVHVYTYKSNDGKTEERRTNEDADGNRSTTVVRSIGDRAYSVTTKKSSSGDEEVTQSYTNMDENNKREFEEQWRERPPMGKNPTLDGHGMIFDMFRKGFPGFPSPKS